MRSAYRGRFAPSPTGPLHAGSLVAALASWLDARAHGGQWLLRIEDVDTPRCVPGAAALIVQQLARLGLHPDAPVAYQSQRSHVYQGALERLVAAGRAYPCACTRADIQHVLAALGVPRERHGELVYPGTCRHGLRGRPARAWRLLTAVPDAVVAWTDRRLGDQVQDVEHAVGDFVLRRADGLWAYQLAVVVDDAAQGITDVVRGEDLADNTARQVLLQRALGLPPLRYLHVPLVRDGRGEKLSKQHGAPALVLDDPVVPLQAAAAALGLRVPAQGLADWLSAAVRQWQAVGLGARRQ